MIIRPFSVRQIPIDDAGSLSVEVLFSDVSSSQVIADHIDTVFGALARFASTGALAGRKLIPLKIGTHGRSGNTFNWSFESREIPAAFSGIIVNLVHGAACLIPEAIVELRLLAPPWHAMPADGSIWPLACLIQPPFAIENTMEGRRLDLVISFKYPTTADVRASFIDVWSNWVTLSVAGGFCDAEHPVGDVSMIASDPPYADAYEISLLHDRFGLDLRAVHVLLAAFTELHRGGAIIEEVVLS